MFLGLRKEDKNDTSESDPDKEIEIFWYGFKTSMINFYKQFKFNRPIDYWSNQLNFLKNMKKYGEIQNKILDYILLYAIDNIRVKDYNHSNILLTNIKRWKKISQLYIFDGYVPDKKIDIMICIYEFYINLTHKKNEEIYNKFSFMFDEIELLLIKHDLDKIIILAFENNQHGILKKLGDFIDCKKIISEYYNEEIINNMGYDKIYKDLIKKKKIIVVND